MWKFNLWGEDRATGVSKMLAELTAPQDALEFIGRSEWPVLYIEAQFGAHVESTEVFADGSLTAYGHNLEQREQ